eukprot:1812521-Rhodomonas_salina.2
MMRRQELMGRVFTLLFISGFALIVDEADSFATHAPLLTTRQACQKLVSSSKHTGLSSRACEAAKGAPSLRMQFGGFLGRGNDPARLTQPFPERALCDLQS